MSLEPLVQTHISRISKKYAHCLILGSVKFTKCIAYEDDLFTQ